MPEGEKLTFAESLALLREQMSSKGWDQAWDLTMNRNALRVVIAHNIKAERTARGITLEQMAQAVNVNALTYRNYESCKSDVPLVYLVRIACFLNLPLDYLVGRIEERALPAADYEKRLSDLENRIAKLEDKE